MNETGLIQNLHDIYLFRYDRKKGSDYPPLTQNNIMAWIQRYLRENGRQINLFDKNHSILDVQTKSRFSNEGSCSQGNRASQEKGCWSSDSGRRENAVGKCLQYQVSKYFNLFRSYLQTDLDIKSLYTFIRNKA